MEEFFPMPVVLSGLMVSNPIRGIGVKIVSWLRFRLIKALSSTEDFSLGYSPKGTYSFVLFETRPKPKLVFVAHQYMHSPDLLNNTKEVANDRTAIWHM